MVRVLLKIDHLQIFPIAKKFMFYYICWRGNTNNTERISQETFVGGGDMTQGRTHSIWEQDPNLESEKNSLDPTIEHGEIHSLSSPIIYIP